MRKLTSVESQYWIDSFPVDLAIGVVLGLVAACLTAWTTDVLALRYYAHHRVLDPGQHHIAALFLALILAAFAFVASVAATLVARLFLRMYRNPL